MYSPSSPQSSEPMSPESDYGSGGSNSIQSSQFSIGKMRVDSEEKVKKRQVRLLKNRQSAALSRHRKKEYIANLESKAQELTHSTQELHIQYNKISSTTFETKSRLEFLEKSLRALRNENEFLRSKFDDIKNNGIKSISNLNLQPSHSISLPQSITSLSTPVQLVHKSPLSSQSETSTSNTSSPSIIPTTLISTKDILNAIPNNNNNNNNNNTTILDQQPSQDSLIKKDREREILIGVNKINHFKFNNNRDCNINNIISSEDDENNSINEEKCKNSEVEEIINNNNSNSNINNNNNIRNHNHNHNNLNSNFSNLSFSSPNVNSSPIYLTRVRSSSYHPSNYIVECTGASGASNIGSGSNHHMIIPTESLIQSQNNNNNNNNNNIESSNKLPSLYQLANNISSSSSSSPSTSSPSTPKSMSFFQPPLFNSNGSSGSGSSSNHRSSIIGLSKLKTFTGNNNNGNSNNNSNNSSPILYPISLQQQQYQQHSNISNNY